MLQPILYLMPCNIGFGSAGGSPVDIGVIRNRAEYVVTGINAFVVGAIAGVAAPVLAVQFASGQNIVLNGVTDDVTAIWEAHWSGWLVVPSDTLLRIFNQNSLSPSVIQATVDGYIPTPIYG